MLTFKPILWFKMYKQIKKCLQRFFYFRLHVDILKSLV